MSDRLEGLDGAEEARNESGYTTPRIEELGNINEMTHTSSVEIGRAHV